MKKQMKKQLMSELGFTLVEVMIATAILGTLSLAVMKLTDQMTKGEKKLTQRYAANDVRTIALYALKSGPACKRSLYTEQPLTLTANAYPTFTKIYQPVPAPGTFAVVIDSISYPSSTNVFGANTRGALKVLAMRVGGLATPIANSTNTATVQIDVQVGDLSLPASPPAVGTKNTMSFSFPLRVVLDGALRITDCYEDQNSFSLASCTNLWGTPRSDGTCEYLNIGGLAAQTTKMFKVNGDGQFASDTSGALMISNSAGTGNILKIAGNNTPDLTSPSIRSDGTNLVLNPKSAGGLYLNYDTAATSNTYINGSNNGKVVVGGVTPTSLLTLSAGSGDGLSVVNGALVGKFYNTGTTMAVGTVSANSLTLDTGNTARVTVDTSGNVTLGTNGANIYLTNPTYVNNSLDDSKAATVWYVRNQIAKSMAPDNTTMGQLALDILNAAANTNQGVRFICEATWINGYQGFWSGNKCNVTTAECGSTAAKRCAGTFYVTALDVSGALTVGGALTVSGATNLNGGLTTTSIQASANINSNTGVCVGSVCATTFAKQDCGIGWAVRGINRGGVFCTRTYP